MKASFVHPAVVWVEFMLEARKEERTDQHSHSGEGEQREGDMGGMGCVTDSVVGVSHER